MLKNNKVVDLDFTYIKISIKKKLNCLLYRVPRSLVERRPWLFRKRERPRCRRFPGFRRKPAGPGTRLARGATVVARKPALAVREEGRCCQSRPFTPLTSTDAGVVSTKTTPTRRRDVTAASAGPVRNNRPRRRWSPRNHLRKDFGSDINQTFV